MMSKVRAAAGAIGELAADSAYQEGSGSFSKEGAITLGQLSGATASLFTSLASGANDEETASNIGIGGFVGANAAVNNALQVQAQRVAGTKNHLTIVHTPEQDEQALYAKKDGYVQDKESGLWIRTWGAGPDNPAAGFLSEVTDMVGTNLLSKSNRDRDADLSIKNYTSPNLVPVSQEGYYVQQLNNLDLNYQDNQKYDLFPSLNSPSGYNSNSYVSGLLIAADIIPPSIPDKEINYQWQGWEYDNSSPINVEYKFPFQVPGYDKPVPSQYFKPSEKRFE